VPSIRDLPTVEQRRDATENARREARYVAAQERIRRIADGLPPLTELQRARLAALLLGTRRSDESEAVPA
jgi:hypothetical protein